MGAVVVIGAIVTLVSYKKIDQIGQPVACILDAKQCPDGSYVGRQGPNCEFAQCPGGNPSPTSQANGSATVAIVQTTVMGGVSISPVDMMSDSRCPTDVKCIWAGNVNSHVKVTKGTDSRTVVFSIGTSVIVGGKKVTMTAVAPSKRSDSTIKTSDYRFTFSVVDSK